MVIFRLNETKNKDIEKIFKKSLKELEKFYEFKLKEPPNVVIIKDLEQAKRLRGQDIPEWIMGFYNQWLNSIFVLDKKNLKRTNIPKDIRYAILIKHELSHLFLYELAGKKATPSWFFEGVCIYLDGSLKHKKRPETFENFLEFEKSGNKEVYKQTGFFIEMMVDKFGKQKLLSFIKSLEKSKSREDFEALFKQIYKFEMNYKNFNKLYKES